MDLRRLKYFVTVAEELNFSRAAARLRMAQPPLTRQVKQLEAELGVILFVRTSKGAELTDAGILLLDEARNLLALSTRAEERVRLAGRGELGGLDIGVFGSSILDLVPKLLMAFRHCYPGVRTALHSMDRAEQIAALRERRITVGFNRLVEPMEDIATESIFREGLFVALNRTHPLAQRARIHLRRLAGHPMVLVPAAPRPSFVDLVTNLCMQEGFEPNVTEITDDVLTSVALVSGGFGLSVVTESTLNLRLPNVVYRPIVAAPSPSVELTCLYRQGDQSPTLKAFLAIVRSFGAKNAAPRAR